VLSRYRVFVYRGDEFSISAYFSGLILPPNDVEEGYRFRDGQREQIGRSGADIQTILQRFGSVQRE